MKMNVDSIQMLDDIYEIQCLLRGVDSLSAAISDEESSLGKNSLNYCKNELFDLAVLKLDAFSQGLRK